MDAMPQVPLGQSNLFLNPDRRCPCVLVLDNSYSMQGAKIDQLNNGIQQFQADVSRDLVALKRIEIDVVTFGPVREVQPFTTVDRLSMPPLVADNDTPMGEAVTTAMKLLENRKADYRQAGVPYFRPWMFLVTDGLPTDDITAGLNDLVLDAANGVHCRMRRLAAERGVHPDQFATTLLGFVVTPERTALAQIGDGGIVMRCRNDPGWRLAFPPHHGEFRNESRFITDRDAMEWLQLSSIERSPGTVIAFTDGLEDLLLSPATLEVHPPLFDHIGQRLERGLHGGLDPDLSAELDDLMVSGSVRSRTDDDTTLLAIHFNGEVL